jgi:hypothetical protein
MIGFQPPNLYANNMRTAIHSLQSLAVSLIFLLPLSCHPALAMGEEGFPDFEQQINEVNEGELQFLTHPPGTPVHHHQNHIIITAESMITGWIQLRQCHYHLDPVPRAQVVYNASHTQNLRIVSQSGIDKAWVEGSTVQLSGIQQLATLCIEAETRAFWPDDQGGFILKNGPYMRRFLDGYYPMHVSLTIQYPGQLLRFHSSRPAPQPGFQIHEKEDQLDIDTWFAGRLFTEIRFDHNI